MVSYKPQSCSSTSAASTSHRWTFTSPGLRYSLVSFFLFQNLGDIWMMPDFKVTLYLFYRTQHIVCLWKKTWKISTRDLVHSTLSFPPPLPFRPNVKLVQACCTVIYPYRHGSYSWSCSMHLLLPIAATSSPRLFSSPYSTSPWYFYYTVYLTNKILTLKILKLEPLMCSLHCGNR